MKILLLTSFFPPTQIAGTEKRTFGYALSLQRLGHDVQVVCAGKWNEGDRYWNGYTDEIYQNIPVRRINLNWTLAPDPNLYLYCNPVIAEQFGEWLKEWAPQVVHITSCVTLSASVIQAANDRNIPVVLTLTDFWFICPRMNLLRGDSSLCNGQTTALDCLQCTLWKTKVSRTLDAVLPPSASGVTLTQISRIPTLTRLPGLRGMAFDMEHRKSYLTSMIRSANYVTAPSAVLSETVNACIGADLVKVIHSGHDLAWLGTLKHRKRTGPVRIAYIGQIIPSKGVHVLVAAYLLTGITDQAELHIYGDSDRYPIYLGELKEQLIGRNAVVKFNGAFPPHLLGEILSEIDVLVVPSMWHENNPRVIQEAFAAKIPVIASNVGGISEFVKNNINGLLFERGNAEDLSKQLDRIVFEPDLLPKFRDGIPPVKSVDEEILEFDAIYNDLVASLTPFSI